MHGTVTIYHVVIANTVKSALTVPAVYCADRIIVTLDSCCAVNDDEIDFAHNFKKLVHANIPHKADLQSDINKPDRAKSQTSLDCS